jgi:hypothetical protein
MNINGKILNDNGIVDKATDTALTFEDAQNAVKRTRTRDTADSP